MKLSRVWRAVTTLPCICLDSSVNVGDDDDDDDDGDDVALLSLAKC